MATRVAPFALGPYAGPNYGRAMLAQADPISWLEVSLIMAGVGALLAVSGLVIIGISVRAADGRLGRNRLAGVRTKATLSSDEAWRIGNETAQRKTKQAGWACIGAALVSPTLALLVGWGDTERAIAIWAIAIGVGTVLLTLLAIKAAIDGNRAAKHYQQDANR